jgi:hypothetical protein
MRLYSWSTGVLTRIGPKEKITVKKLMIASLGLSLLTGSAVFAQNTSTSSDTMAKKHSKKKAKKDTMSTTSTSTSK